MARVAIEGVEKLRAVLSRMSNESGPMLGKAIYQEAESEIMPLAKERTPVDQGILKASGLVSLPEITPTGASVEMGFGGAASDYAVPVHERSDLRHTVGQWKFLESAALDSAHGMGARLASRIQRMFRR